MASRRSHAPSHNITSISTRYKITYYSRVPRGHVSIRNPLQAAKQRSCGISITSPSLGSAKRDRLSSSTSYGMRQSPFGELYGWRCRTYPQLRCFAACSGFHYYRSRSAEPAAHTICIIFLSKDPVFPSKHEKGFRNLKSRNPFYHVNAMRRCRLHSFVLLLNDNLACCTVRELEDVDALNRSRNL